MAKFDFSVREKVNKLIGDLGETFYKNYSEQTRTQYAYARAEDIGWDFIHKKVIRFKKGFFRIEVRIPNELFELLKEIILPNPDYPKTPAYSFDFLSCRITDEEIENLKVNEVLENKPLSQFTIVEIKTGHSELTKNEQKVKELCKERGIKYNVYRISNIRDKLVTEWNFTIDYD